MRWLMPVAGALLIAVGALWTFQGLGVIGDSGMSGRTEWAVIGPIVAGLGIWLLVRGLRRGR